MKKFFAMESKGELPAGIVKKWVEHTPNLKSLPKKVNKKKK